MVVRESEVEELKTIVLNPLFLRNRCVPLTPILELVKSEESTKCCQREILDVFFFLQFLLSPDASVQQLHNSVLLNKNDC
jgi:hypothetical protein